KHGAYKFSAVAGHTQLHEQIGQCTIGPMSDGLFARQKTKWRVGEKRHLPPFLRQREQFTAHGCLHDTFVKHSTVLQKIQTGVKISLDRHTIFFYDSLLLQLLHPPDGIVKSFSGRIKTMEKKRIQ